VSTLGQPGNNGNNVTLIIDVTASSQDPGNSGVLRVARQLCRELQKYMDPIFVIWKPDLNCYILPMKKQYLHLQHFHGPSLTDEERLSKRGRLILLHDYLETDERDRYWLILPEIISEISAVQRRYYARKNNLKIAAIFHDAIPVLHPEFCSEEIINNHPYYMSGLSKCDVVIPISEYSGKCLKTFWDQNNVKGCPIQANPLPGEFSGTERNTKIPDKLPRVIKMLFVSTLEPRKNHLRLAESCLIMKEKHPEVQWRLRLVGSRYSGNGDIPEFIQSISKRNKNIKWLGAVDDNSLIDLYNDATFTVFPSIIEGFGMPILESIWFGKPCICSQNGVMGELAEGGGCLATDVEDANTLSEAIHRLSTDDKFFLQLSKEAATRKVIKWSEYAEKLISILKAPRTLEQRAVGDVRKTFQEIVYPGQVNSKCLMSNSERLALTALLARHKPEYSIAICAYDECLLALFSEYSKSVFTILVDSEMGRKNGKYGNMSFLTGNSGKIVPLLLKELDKENMPVDFVFIYMGYSTGKGKRDIDAVLSYVPKKPLFLVLYNSFNPEVRKDLLEAEWKKSPYVHWVDLDFIPGRMVRADKNDMESMTGGLSMVYLSPEKCDKAMDLGLGDVRE
jgi:glycosyltransferase involved in cell wall biosynthesis